MPAILLELDPTSEDAANVSVVLTDTTWRVMEMDLSPPDIDPIYSSSADTEGDQFIQGRHKNRTISLTLLAKATTDQLLQTAVYGLMQKLDKMRREGGTLKWTTQAGTVVVADVLFAAVKSEITPELYVANKAMKITADLECKPYLRGTAVQLSDHIETTLPVAIGVDTSVGGDVPATVKILIDEDQAANQWWLVWGVQSRYYDSATSAALFYEAEGRTLGGGSAAIVTQTGASGGGTNNAIEATLDTDFQSILTTQATAAGAHLSHIGNFRVFARFLTPTANTGAVSVALTWGEGDFLNSTTNTQVDFPVDSWDNTFRLVDLGQVHLTKAAAGTQRWEGRFLAKSTVQGDKVRIDHFFLVPIDEGSGEASGIVRQQVPTTFTGRDSFLATTAGNALNARVAPTGGTWATSGDATDFVFSDDVLSGLPVRTEPLKRTTAAAGTTGRFAILGAATPTLVEARVAVRNASLTLGTSQQLSQGVIARWVDSSNYLRGYLYRVQDPAAGLVRGIVLDQVVAGTATQLASALNILPSGSTDIWFIVRLFVTVEGQAVVQLWAEGFNNLIATAAGSSTALATGGALASGKSGIWDFTTNTSSQVRYYDDFSVFVPVTDAAMFASQSLELRSDRVVREDAGGTLWQRPSVYEGDYPTFPPAGKEARSVRTIVKACRNDPATGADATIDDLSFRATVTPRYLQVPA